MKTSLATTNALALVLALTATNVASAEEVTAWRLFVSDHAEPKVTVVDAVDGTTLETLPIKAPASLYRSDSGRTVFAVQGSAGTVTALSSGIAFEDHGDHGDIDIEAAKLLGVEITGEKPSHFVEHDGQFAAFFDGEGIARIFSERDVLKGPADVREVKSSAPHHGVVIPFGNYDIVSEPNPDDSSKPPAGVRILDHDGKQIGDGVECVGLHGEAASGNLVALGGCADGILIARSGSDAPVVEPLSFTEGLPDGRVSTLIGGRGLQYFLGNYGTDRIVLIDPTAHSAAFRLIDLPTRRVHFAVDPIRAKFAYVFTEDGQLHQVDVVRGAITNSIKLTEPYSMDGHWSDPRPRVAVAGHRIIVTDPLKSALHFVDAESFQKAGELAVEGKPSNIVSVGGSGETHED